MASKAPVRSRYRMDGLWYCGSYFYHLNVSFLSEKTELIVLNYRAARIRALGRQLTDPKEAVKGK